jgi:hypothetical protein
MIIVLILLSVLNIVLSLALGFIIISTLGRLGSLEKIHVEKGVVMS